MQGRKALGSFGTLLVGAALLTAAALARGTHTGIRNGGTFRVAAVQIDSIDPALAGGSAYLDASCALLLRAGGKPEVASGPPSVSRDGRTYTFHLKKTFRFQTGTKVTAANFAQELDRSLNPALGSPGAEFLSEVVGAQKVIEGRTMHAAGIQARGYTLKISLTQPAPDFPARLSQPYACAVPTRLAASPNAVRAPFSGAGPYYIAEYIPGSRVVLRRNSHYRGRRQHSVAKIVVTLVADNQAALSTVADGHADWADFTRTNLFSPHDLGRVRARVRFLTGPSLFAAYLVMNTSRPLFRNNVRLRQAVNFALDRKAIAAVFRRFVPAAPTDQYLPRAMLGFRDAHIYPFRPNVGRARPLARGHRRGGRAVLYATASGPALEQAQIVKADLARIGITVEIRSFPNAQLLQRLGNPNEPYDLVFLGWRAAYADPYDVLNALLDGRQLRRSGNTNFARFNSPRWNQRLAHAARLTGRARYRAYAKLDLQLPRAAAPLAALVNAGNRIIVSKRTRCVRIDTVGGFPDLAAVCLR